MDGREAPVHACAWRRVLLKAATEALRGSLPARPHPPVHGAVALTLIKAWLPAIVWMAVIFFVSSRPDLPGAPDPLLDLVLKKLAHVAEYAVLGYLLARATGTPRWAWLLGALYGLSDEIHQAFVPGRQGRIADWLLDAFGAGLGAWLWPRPRLGDGQHRRQRRGHDLH